LKKIFCHFQNDKCANRAGPGGWNDPDSKFFIVSI